MYFPLFVGGMCLYLFIYALLCVHSSFEEEEKAVVLRCSVTKMFCSFSTHCCWLVCSVIVVFPDLTHLLFSAVMENVLQLRDFMIQCIYFQQIRMENL